MTATKYPLLVWKNPGLEKKKLHGGRTARREMVNYYYNCFGGIGWIGSLSHLQGERFAGNTISRSTTVTRLGAECRVWGKGEGKRSCSALSVFGRISCFKLICFRPLIERVKELNGCMQGNWIIFTSLKSLDNCNWKVYLTYYCQVLISKFQTEREKGDKGINLDNRELLRLGLLEMRDLEQSAKLCWVISCVCYVKSVI